MERSEREARAALSISHGGGCGELQSDCTTAALGACFACAGGCAPAARRGSLQRAPKVQASGKLRIALLYEPINH